MLISDSNALPQLLHHSIIRPFFRLNHPYALASSPIGRHGIECCLFVPLERWVSNSDLLKTLMGFAN